MRRLLLAVLLLIPQVAPAAISWVASGAKAGGTTGTSMTPALPAGIVVGDIVVAVAGARETAQAMSTATTGWSSKVEGATTNLRYGIWWMRYTGSETAPTITRPTGTQAWVGYCFAVRGVDFGVSDPFDVLGSYAQTTTSPATASAVASVTDNAWAIAIFISGGAGSLPVQTISTGSIATTTNLLQNQTQSTTANRIVISVWRGSAGLGAAGTSTGTQAITWTNTTSNFTAYVIAAFRAQPEPSGGMMGFSP